LVVVTLTTPLVFGVHENEYPKGVLVAKYARAVGAVPTDALIPTAVTSLDTGWS
jgi:hypothetical protein